MVMQERRRFDDAQDATRRTRLANERTYLAWWRTGLTSLAVAIGIGKIVPGVSGVTKWPYEAVGAAYGLLGVAFMLVAHMRVRSVCRSGGFRIGGPSFFAPLTLYEDC